MKDVNQMKDRLIWVDTPGSPLILINELVAKDWEGIDGDEYDSVVDASMTDYCSKLPFMDTTLVIMGDEPMMAAYKEIGKNSCIVRLHHAPDIEDVDKFLSELKIDHYSPVEEIDVHLEKGNYILFDSADDFSPELDKVSFRLENDVQKICTYDLANEDNTIRVILHTFVQ